MFSDIYVGLWEGGIKFPENVLPVLILIRLLFMYKNCWVEFGVFESFSKIN